MFTQLGLTGNTTNDLLPVWSYSHLIFFFKRSSFSAVDLGLHFASDLHPEKVIDHFHRRFCLLTHCKQGWKLRPAKCGQMLSLAGKNVNFTSHVGRWWNRAFEIFFFFNKTFFSLQMLRVGDVELIKAATVWLYLSQCFLDSLYSFFVNTLGCFSMFSLSLLLL